MANLFVVFTPLQVVIAQQIIRQEKLSNNVMLESYLGNFTHFLDIYKMVMIRELWSRIIPFEQWARWDSSGINLLKNAIKTKKRAQELKRVLKENNVDTIYLADFQNQTNRFTCVWLANLGYKIAFYEEGYSHYIPRPATIPPQNILHDVYEKMLDIFYYQPLFHVNFAKWRCYPNKDYHGLPISVRYSVIPNIHHETYDRLLKCEPMISPQLQSFINDEIKNTKEKKILLLTDPMTEVLQIQYRHLYFETISDALDKYKDECIVVKFHPRECELDIEKTLNLIRSKGLDYSILGQRVNLPVELYLQDYHFDEIIFFNTSTYFYNGYLFPKTFFVKLLPALYKKCVDNNVQDLRQMELLLKNLTD